MNTLPMVDLDGFHALQCNRCGSCCESMVLDFDPTERLRYLRQHRQAHNPGMTHRKTVHEFRMIKSMLQPTGEHASNGSPRYRCRHFRRDDAGLGVCTVYETRPSMCSRFPYSQPQKFPGCVWDVRVVRRMLPLAVVQSSGDGS